MPETKTNARVDGQSFLDALETSSAESSSEIKETETTQSDEGEPEAKAKENTQTEKEVPWHEDPRWRKWKEEKETLEAKAREFDELKTKIEPILTKEAEKKSSIPRWFGGDETQWAEYQADQTKLVDSVRKQTLEEVNRMTAAQQEAINKANEHFETSVDELKAEGIKVEKNRLMKYVFENNLVQPDGRWNYKLGAKYLDLQDKAKEEKPDLSDRKRLSAASMGGTDSDVKKKDYATQEDFAHNRPW